jgi:hypothetical protein
MRIPSAAFALALLAAALPASADVLGGRFGTPGSTDANVISAYADGASGDVAPVALIGGPASGLQSALGMSYHADDHTLIVADFRGQQVKVFDSAGRGDSAPMRTFTHPLMGQPRMARAIPAHDEIAVVNASFIRYYPRSADGATAPLRSTALIPGVVNNLSSLVYLPATDEVAAGDGYAPAGGGSAGEVLFFDRATPGAATTTRRLAGPLTRLGTFVLGLAHDPASGELFVLAGNADGSGSIQVFPDSASGDVAPIRSIEGPATLMQNVASLSYFAHRDELLVASGAFNAEPRLLGFPRLASGDVAPTRNIGGPATGVGAPNGWYGVVGVPPDTLFSNGFD